MPPTTFDQIRGMSDIELLSVYTLLAQTQPDTGNLEYNALAFEILNRMES